MWQNVETFIRLQATVHLFYLLTLLYFGSVHSSAFTGPVKPSQPAIISPAQFLWWQYHIPWCNRNTSANNLSLSLTSNPGPNYRIKNFGIGGGWCGCKWILPFNMWLYGQGSPCLFEIRHVTETNLNEKSAECQMLQWLFMSCKKNAVKIWCLLILGICILFCTLPSFSTGKENVCIKRRKTKCFMTILKKWLVTNNWFSGYLSLMQAALHFQSFTLSCHTTQCKYLPKHTTWTNK